VVVKLLEVFTYILSAKPCQMNQRIMKNLSYACAVLLRNVIVKNELNFIVKVSLFIFLHPLLRHDLYLITVVLLTRARERKINVHIEINSSSINFPYR
jgi:hypothetical protein